MRRTLRIGLLLVAALTGACAGTADPIEDDPLGDGRAVVDVELDVSDVRAAGVGVLATGCGTTASAGSGVIVGEPGQVVTVAHTVAGASSVIVVDEDGDQFAAEIIGFDPALDLAVLDVDGLGGTPLELGEVHLGASTLVVWDHDEGVSAQPVGVTQRLAITIDDIYGEESVRRSGLEIAGDIVVGDSGGPVVAADGSVMGIVYARSRSRASTAFATDSSEVSALLDSIDGGRVENGRCV